MGPFTPGNCSVSEPWLGTTSARVVGRCPSASASGEKASDAAAARAAEDRTRDRRRFANTCVFSFGLDAVDGRRVSFIRMNGINFFEREGWPGGPVFSTAGGNCSVGIYGACL